MDLISLKTNCLENLSLISGGNNFLPDFIYLAAELKIIRPEPGFNLISVNNLVFYHFYFIFYLLVYLHMNFNLQNYMILFSCDLWLF
jgi:hypothetical protein